MDCQMPFALRGLHTNDDSARMNETLQTCFARSRSATPVSRRHRERQHLRHCSRIDSESPGRFAPAQSLNVNRSPYLPIQFPSCRVTL